MVPQKAKNAWEARTGLERILASALATVTLAVLAGGGWAAVTPHEQGPVPMDPQVEINTRNIARQDTAISELSVSVDSLRADRKGDRAVLDFLSCGQESRINGIPETPCLRYLTGRRP
jgi:hypothetical protein